MIAEPRGILSRGTRRERRMENFSCLIAGSSQLVAIKGLQAMSAELRGMYLAEHAESTERKTFPAS